MQIETRKDMYLYLGDVLTKTYDEIKKYQKYEFGQNLLKSYVIESNLDSITALPKFEKSDIKISKTRDDTLFLLEYKKEEKKGEFFVDTINPRFWVFHTVSKSDFTDAFINKLVTQTINGLDHPWLDTQFLEAIGEREQFRGFSLRYKDEFMEDKEEETAPVGYLSMRLWGYTAPKVLKALRSNDELKHSIALSGVGIKRILNGNEEFIIEDITYQGKFTGRGTSIDGHFFVINRIVGEYASKIEAIEKNAIEYERTDSGYRFNGQPITIILDKEIEDLDSFLKDFFSSTQPFRLWGARKRLDKNFYRVNSIDLHTGHKLNMEVTPEWIRIYLPKGSCGNTIYRLFTNVQQYSIASILFWIS